MKLLFSAENVRFFALVFFCADWFWNLRMTEARRHVAVDGGRNFYRLASRFPLGSVCQKIMYNVRIWIPFAISNQNSPGFLMGYNVPVFFLDKSITYLEKQDCWSTLECFGRFNLFGDFYTPENSEENRKFKKTSKKELQIRSFGYYYFTKILIPNVKGETEQKENL